MLFCSPLRIEQTAIKFIVRTRTLLRRLRTARDFRHWTRTCVTPSCESQFDDRTALWMKWLSGRARIRLKLAEFPFSAVKQRLCGIVDRIDRLNFFLSANGAICSKHSGRKMTISRCSATARRAIKSRSALSKNLNRIN